ncbi:putative ABC-type transporter, permease protein [metagenome]|uniref:Putative ABC-type transporter, permease protein n=1 Tax=metagenome TaxID=256318 RepID=A0A2P2C410_9ZZZZ
MTNTDTVERVAAVKESALAGTTSGAVARLRGGKWGALIFRGVAPLIVLVLLVLAWHAAVEIKNFSPTVLPSPKRVWDATIEDRANLWSNTVPTLKVTLLGLAVSVAVSVVLATMLSFVGTLRTAFLPLLVGAQSIPVIVMAPLFVIWFGFGMGPKIGLIAIFTTLPMTISLLQGFMSADPDAATLMRSMGASRVQVFLRLQVPTSLPFFFAGLRMVASYAVLAAIFAETVGAFNGLGLYMATQKNLLRTDLVLAATIITIVVGLVLFASTYLLEALAMPWERRRRAMRSE